MFLWVLVILLY